MRDHRLDGGAALELALDLRGDATLLAGGVDPEPVLGRSVVAAIQTRLPMYSRILNRITQDTGSCSIMISPCFGLRSSA
jgi:hypothetical protein